MKLNDNHQEDLIELGSVSRETRGVGTPNDDMSGLGHRHGITEE